MTDASSEEEEEEDDYSPTVSRRRRRPTATPSSAATPKSAARRNKGKAKAGVVASAAPVVAVARPPPPTYVPPAGHWVTRINQPQVTHAHGRPYYSPLKMDENCALSIQDLVNLSPLVQAMGKKQLEPCFYAFKVTAIH